MGRRYDSPELIRHGDDLWLLARRDVGGPFGPEGDLLAAQTSDRWTQIYLAELAFFAE